MKGLFIFSVAIFFLFSALSTAQSGNRADFTWDWIGPETGTMWRVGIDPSNNNLALAVSNGGHLWRTVDGSSWILVQDFRYNSPTTVLYTAPDTALVVKNDSLFYTPDGGNNWYPGTIPCYDIEGLSEQVSNIVYLSGYAGVPDARIIYRSSDCGFTWTLIDTIFDHGKFHCIRFDPSNDSIIYYGTRYTGGSIDTTVILKSTDMGASWNRIFASHDSLTISGVIDIEVNPYDGDEIFVSCGFEAPGTGPIHSQDGGNTWSALPGALAAGLLLPYDVEFSDSDTVIVANIFPPAMFKGINFPAVGWQFIRVDSMASYTDVELGSGGTYYAASFGDGMFKSTNFGFSWTAINTDLRAHITASPSGEVVSECVGSTFYTKSMYSTSLYKTTNGGLTWQKFICPYCISANSIELFRGNPDIVYIGGFGVEFTLPNPHFFDFFRSTDGGQTWTPMDTISMTPSGPGNAFYSLWVSPTDSSRILAIYMPSDTTPLLIRSSNSGVDWDTVFYDVHNTKLAGTDTVFVAADTTLYASFDKGITWQPLRYNVQIYEMSYNPENQLLYCIRPTGSGDSLGCIDLSGTLTNIQEMSGGFHCMSTPGDDDIFLSFLLGYLPLFVRSWDGGQTFDIDTLDFFPVELRATPSEILLGDLGLSFRRSADAAGISFEDETPVFPYSLKTSQSVFSNNIEIRFSLPRPEQITLSIWGIDGRLVKTVHDGKCGQGSHAFLWDGKNEGGLSAPSGIYFISMQIKDECIPAIKVIKIK